MLELLMLSKGPNLMLAFFQQWKDKKARQNLFLDFYEELKKNLESYYVMDQLGRFRFFRMETWLRIKNSGNPAILGDKMINDYAQRLQEYNAVTDDFTKYEQWYGSDIENKTPANARILHDKREEPRIKFQGLEGVIKSAIQSFEKKLLEEKILK